MGTLARVPNINSKILMWIHDFFSERKQKVVVAIFEDFCDFGCATGHRARTNSVPGLY